MNSPIVNSETFEVEQAERRKRPSPALLPSDREPESIIGIKGQRRGCKYLVKWKNLPEDASTWETARCFDLYPQFFLEFKKARKFLPLRVYMDDKRTKDDDGHRFIRPSAKSHPTHIGNSFTRVDFSKELDRHDRLSHETIEEEGEEGAKNRESNRRDNFQRLTQESIPQRQIPTESHDLPRQNRDFTRQGRGVETIPVDRRSIIQNFMKILDSEEPNMHSEAGDSRANNKPKISSSTGGASHRLKDIGPSFNRLNERSKHSKSIHLSNPLNPSQPSDLQSQDRIKKVPPQLDLTDSEEEKIEAEYLGVDDLMVQSAKEIIGHVIFQKMMFFRLLWDKGAVHGNLELKYYPYSRVYRLNPAIVSEYAMKYLITNGKRMKRDDQ